MPYTPVIKTTTLLLADISAAIQANGVNGITGPILGQILSDITASLVNKVENLNLLGLSNYDTARAYKGGLIGDTCINNGAILQCITDTQGVFNAAHWKTIAGLESLTRSALNTKIGSSALVPGVIYYISDRSIYLRAISQNRLDPRGVRIYRVPRYEELNGDGHLITVWGQPEAASIVVDQHVAYNGVVYIRTNTGDNSNGPDINANYTAVATSSTLYKDYPVSVTYDIADDILLDARDQYGNIAISSRQVLDDFSITDAFFEYVRWGDPYFVNNVMYNAVAYSVNSPVKIKNCVFFQGSSLFVNPQSSRTAVLINNVHGAGSVVTGLGMYEDSIVSNSRFLEGCDWSSKILPANYVINNFTCGIQWPDSTAMSTVELTNKTITPAVNDVVAELDVDLFVTNPSGGIQQLEILPVWWAGTIKLKSLSLATGVVVNRITSYDGAWPYKFIAAAADVVRFESVATNPTDSQLYFGGSDTETPFDGLGKGFIVFRKNAPGEWICEASKEI